MSDKTDIDRYNETIRRRDAGKSTLGDAVTIARGRPGPPDVPIAFDSPDEDAEYKAERQAYDDMYPPGSACNAACGYCGGCN